MTAPAAETADEVLRDQLALVDALADYATASAVREAAEARALALARRLTQDWRLTDAEAVERAGRAAIAATRELAEKG